jgi:aspergillopepsin I
LNKYKADEKQIAQVKAATGSVTATPASDDSEYLCPVTIGSQTFQLDFDTGSSDLWVLGPDAGAGGTHTIYTPGSSATQEQGETWSITYGDGSSASGDVYSDSVTIGGLAVTGQAVEQATTASSAFTSGPNDGLVGLAFDTLNTVQPDQAKTFFSNAVAQGTTGVLTADLRKGEPGSYTFGDIPSNL